MGDLVRRGDRWYVRYKDADGVRRMRASHQPTRALARRYLLAIEARVARGLVGIDEPDGPPLTVAALIERFLREYSRPRIKDLAAYRASARRALGRTLVHLGKRSARTLQKADVGRLRDALAATYAPASVRLSLSFLGAVYAWAVRLGLVPDNPVVGVERPRPATALDYLGRAEVQALLRTAAQRADQSLADQRLYACVHLALHSGLRKGELLGLRWQDLDLHTLRLTVARNYETTPKSGKPRPLRLPRQCVPVLTQWQARCPRSRAGLVFPADDGAMLGGHAMLGLPRLLVAAGCRALAHPWHALRHTFASHFIMSGGNLLTLQQILGHSDIKMTLLYAHLSPDFLGDEMDRLKF
jgi:site-specific recombinase XerD